jgi:MFS transporter, DHA1 family, multidrug resistance protein
VHPERRRFIALLPALVALQAISTDLYLPALPSIVIDLRTDVARVQLTLSIFLIAFAVAQLAYGPLSDRFGRRSLLVVGTTIYVAASLACMLARTIEELVLFRLLQAVGACSGPVIGRAVVRDVYEPLEAGRVLAYIATAMALAPAAGPILGGWLTEAFGWRASFAALALFGMGSLLGVLLVLPETNRYKDANAIRPAVLLANYAELLGTRAFLAFAAIAACTYSGIFVFISGSAYVLIDVVGLSPTGYGMSFAAGILGWALGAFLCGQLNPRLGLAGLLAWGTAIAAAAGLIGLAGALTTRPSVVGVVLPMAIFMLGAGFVLPSAMAMAIGPYPTRAGLASALLGFLQLTIAACVGVILSLIYDGTAVPMMGLLAVVTLVALVIWRSAPKPEAIAQRGTARPLRNQNHDDTRD